QPHLGGRERSGRGGDGQGVPGPGVPVREGRGGLRDPRGAGGPHARTRGRLRADPAGEWTGGLDASRGRGSGELDGSRTVTYEGWLRRGLPSAPLSEAT